MAAWPLLPVPRLCPDPPTPLLPLAPLAANSSLCLACPGNTTTLGDGQAACAVPLRPGKERQSHRCAAAAEASVLGAAGGACCPWPEPPPSLLPTKRSYAVVVSFWVLLEGLDPQDVVVQVGCTSRRDVRATADGGWLHASGGRARARRRMSAALPCRPSPSASLPHHRLSCPPPPPAPPAGGRGPAPCRGGGCAGARRHRRLLRHPYGWVGAGGVARGAAESCYEPGRCASIQLFGDWQPPSSRPAPFGPSPRHPLLPHSFCRAAADVEVRVQHVARRTLTANVTATLGVDVPAGASGTWCRPTVCCLSCTWSDGSPGTPVCRPASASPPTCPHTHRLPNCHITP